MKSHQPVPGVSAAKAALPGVPAADAKPFPVVAVGASAGGLEAFTKFLEVFPHDSGVAIIFVQHLDPSHESLMVGLLQPHTRMSVREAMDGARLERNTVYVITPGTYVALGAGTLIVTAPQERHGARLPFDFLLRSVAVACGERAFGVVLSGNGEDGTLGLKAVRDRGGLAVAQDPQEAAHDGMPKSAIDAGAVDLVLPLQKIPHALSAYAQKMQQQWSDKQSVGHGDDDEGLARVMSVLKARASQDLASYKSGTLVRRIKRRMAMQAIDDVSAYAALLESDSKEVEALAKDVLIHVTEFFRDGRVFEHLAAHVVPELIRQHPTGQPLRIWVPACSSGEEVYSLAIILLEEMAKAKKTLKLQMFGTDVDAQAVAVARDGRYSQAALSELSPERVARFFVPDVGGFRISPALREAVVFTVQDILADPPFSRIDLVSCRNLLIYLLPEAQQHVLSLLHFALREDGFLLLGIAESVGGMREEFTPLAEDLRLFRRVGASRRILPQFAANRQRSFWPRPTQVAVNRTVTTQEMCQQLLTNSYAPPSVLVNHRHECLHYFGQTERFLQIPAGDATAGLLAMLRPALRNKLRIALQRARAERDMVTIPASSTKNDGGALAVRLEVRPIITKDQELFLVSFIEMPVSADGDAPKSGEGSEDKSKVAALEDAVERLERELLEAARELERSSADQEAINEEAESLNEEHQSTNEELESSKEELQSLNEELKALNSQLSATVNQQRNTADDLENILRSANLAIVFLDPALNIRFFSSAAKVLFRTIDTDLGRPIGDLSLKFDDDNLVMDVQAVLDTQTSSSREVQAHNGDWYARGALPYRTRAGAIQGVVLTFGNITQMKAAEFKIGMERTYAVSVIDTVHQPLVVVDQRLRIVSSNLAFRNTFDFAAEELVGRRLASVGGGSLDLPLLHHFLDRAQAESTPIEGYEIEVVLPSLGRRTFVLSSRKLAGETAEHRLLIALEDITERKGTRVALEGAKLKAEQANLGKSRFLAAASHDLRQPLQTLSLLHGLLARRVPDADSKLLIAKLNETLGAMAGMLDTLLDINQLEAGTVQPEIDDIAVAPILEQLKSEFTYIAKSKGIALHVIASGACVRTDPLLLSQMLRNLLSNAVKYTKRGKIVIGCRREGREVRLEVWDSGIGIPADQLKAIFEEYHQLGNPARERGLGLGLGLSIVRRIGDLLGHRVEVRSELGKGSVFIVRVPHVEQSRGAAPKKDDEYAAANSPASHGRTILIVEDDPTVRDALELLFKGDGYRTVTAVDGMEVVSMMRRGAPVPDIVVADYNLPGARTGLEVVADLRISLKREVPAVILTGDIATDVLRNVVAADCSFLRKPVNVDQLSRCIEDLIARSDKGEPASARPRPVAGPTTQGEPTIFVVDDDEALLGSLADMLRGRGHAVETHTSGEAFLAAFHAGRQGCLVVDSVMPGMSGLDLLRRLQNDNRDIPAIVITGYGDIPMAIKAMQVGAMDFIEKPAKESDLVASIGRAMAQRGSSPRTVAQEEAAARIAVLTPRERAVMDLVVDGLANKNIAVKLNISQRTVEAHRAAVMKRTGAGSLADLIRLVMQAA